MNPNFPNASQITRDLNPAIFAHPAKKNAVARRTGMNKAEHEFSLILEAKKRSVEIDGWKYEGVRLKLADRTTYTPDFISWEYSTLDITFKIKFYEIKGPFIRTGDDGMVKFKIAREQTPWATFELWQKQKTGWKQIL